MRVLHTGDRAFTLCMPSDAAAWKAAARLRGAGIAGISDVVAAFDRVAVYYDPLSAGTTPRLIRAVTDALARSAPDNEAVRPAEHQIPVCYASEHAPDLTEVASVAGLSRREVIELHAGGNYRVLAVGFMPGFAYLGGLPEVLHLPRRPSPRARVPAGAVGIGGTYTGIYPSVSPGGWRLIGRTPLSMFDPTVTRPARLNVGDTVRFRPISAAELDAWR